MRNIFAIALLAAALAACATNKGGSTAPDGIDESAKLIGTWKMFPTGGGIANVVELTPEGESRLYPYNCVTREQPAPEVGHYLVDSSHRTIQIKTRGDSQTLKIVSVSDATLELSQRVGDQQITLKYMRGSDHVSLCGADARWEKERSKRSPYASTDFAPDPAIPLHSDMDRYVGRWADEKGVVQIEVKRLADGSYQLNHDANENWTYLFNAVHWEGNELHYTSFAYANRSDLFGHPFHKSSTEGFLTPMPNGASITYGFFIGSKRYELVLNRK
nr:hypothetical protein [Dyella sp. ASV24]